MGEEIEDAVDKFCDDAEDGAVVRLEAPFADVIGGPSGVARARHGLTVLSPKLCVCSAGSVGETGSVLWKDPQYLQTPSTYSCRQTKLAPICAA